ncbi:S41 family peptidase [Nitrospirillum sp. BR 11163]|uniref:S41 family peptidase n=1 Tax=Nitrospirillum sp. BR 11163 TaxID=3104323 RepID=UPI002AFDD5D9|nr:S41 family peptidase [Nitrospirillum sp. BR 11163]MEA1672075.1 S41 family peptidase [Nitrospirillum sp. BR 11163]
MMKRACARTIGCFILGMAMACATATAQISPEPTYPAADVRADMDTLYRRLQADAFDLYAFTPKADMDRLHRQLRTDITTPLTRAQAEARLELLAAAAHQGHTRVEGVYATWAAYQKAGGLAFPLAVRIKEGRIYIARNLSDRAQLAPGDQILAIDGVPVTTWLTRLRRHISAETPALADSILEYDFPLYLWVATGARPAFKVIVKPAGASVPDTVTLTARTKVDMASTSQSRPPALDLAQPLRDARVLANGVGYLRPGPFYNEAAKTGADEWDVASFRTFIDGAFRSFKAQGVTRLIIDLRGNPGGDSLFSDVMVSWFATRPYQFFSSFRIRVSADAVAANRNRIARDAVAAGAISQRFADLYATATPGDVIALTLPDSQPNREERFTGKVYALVNRQTYSNAVAVAATIQDYGFGRILGEPTTDMATAFGAMERFTLPATGITVGFPKAHIIRPNGDTRARGVTPDIAIPFPIVETPDDPVLQHAIRIAAADAP